jgi:hypothetical protein
LAAEKPSVGADDSNKSVNLEAPLSPNASREKLTPKPELSKDVKRVFGEDEDLT